MLKKGDKYLCKSPIEFIKTSMKYHNYYEIYSFDENIIWVNVEGYLQMFVKHEGFDDVLFFFDFFYNKQEERAIKLKTLSKSNIL
jgi:hypothetical protein